MVHSHGKSHLSKYRNAFLIGIILNIGYIAVEVFFGLRANSSALLADAGHNASDVLSLAFAWAATWLASIRPKGKYTYGLRKTTILVSILNALLLFVAVAIIGWEAIGKIINPQPVAGGQVMIVAGIGVIINTATALLFIKGQKDDLNIKGAFLHMAADAGVSLGVVFSGLMIYLTGALWIDPLTSFLIIGGVVWATWRLFIDSLDLALDAVPRNINVEEVREYLLSKKGVCEIHDLHIWAMSTTMVALTTHLIMPDGNEDSFIAELQKEIHEKFGIEHTTFQIETGNMKEECHKEC